MPLLFLICVTAYVIVGVVIYFLSFDIAKSTYVTNAISQTMRCIVNTCIAVKVLVMASRVIYGMLYSVYV